MKKLYKCNILMLSLKRLKYETVFSNAFLILTPVTNARVYRIVR